MHLFLPYFDTGAVESVVASLHNAEDVPPAETGSSRNLVVLKRREGTDDIFAALDEAVTYRVNATRAQSPLRRYMAISRSMTIDEIDEDAWGAAKQQIVEWMGQRIAAIKTAGQFDTAAKAITQVGLRTLAVNNGTGVVEPEPVKYAVDVSDVDIDRLFEEAGRAFSHGLQMEYWRTHADRDALEVKVEAIVLARNAVEMARLEAQAEAAFDALYDRHKKAIYKLKEQRRLNYEKLRLATAKPTEVPWHLPTSIDFKRLPTDPLWDRHLYVEGYGQFRTELSSWEAEVLKEELVKPEVVGWLRNLDRKPWSLEIPYETGGDVRPMFPDLVVVRALGTEFAIDILEPHDPSLSDNFEKAVGLAKFAEKHGALFGRIQLIRQQTSAGGEHFARLEINQTAMMSHLAYGKPNKDYEDLLEKKGWKWEASKQTFSGTDYMVFTRKTGQKIEKIISEEKALRKEIEKLEKRVSFSVRSNNLLQVIDSVISDQDFVNDFLLIKSFYKLVIVSPEELVFVISGSMDTEELSCCIDELNTIPSLFTKLYIDYDQQKGIKYRVVYHV